ncbi:MAG: ECF-type sigma factor, partial [Acidobacteriota bacterium]
MTQQEISGPVTELLSRWRAGSEEALHQLMPLVYDELRRIARRHMQGERSDHTLDPTELVHQAYQRLLGVELDWQDRAHFLNMASRTMRRVLVEHARA